MKARNSKAGFTLIELIVYSGLIGVIVVIAGQAFSNSTKFRVRSENMIRSTSTANSLSTLLSEDLSQMGSKTDLGDGAYHFFNQAYNDPESDSSSYVLVPRDFHDSISFKRVYNGTDGKALYLQQIDWYLEEEGALYRKCRTLAKLSEEEPLAECPEVPGDGEDVQPVLMSENISEFSLTPGRRLQDASGCETTNFADGCFKLGSVYTLASRSSTGITPVIVQKASESAATEIKGFYSNYDGESNYHSQVYLLNGSVDNPIWGQCSEFTFKPNVTYGVSFSLMVESDISNVNYMRNFMAEYDHVSVGFRTNEGDPIEGIQDHMVYPAQGEIDTERYFEFSFPREVTNACLVFTFAFYSKYAADGALAISGLSVFPRDESSYDFNPPPPDSLKSDKRLHKAFKYRLVTNVGGESTVIEKFVPTPNNGI